MKISHSSVPATSISPGLRYLEIPGDDHCLYHAVSLYVAKDQQTLRNIVIGYLEHNKENFSEFIPENRNIDEYICDLKGGRAWADDVEINVLMRVLNRPIVIIDPTGTIRNRNAVLGEGEPIFVYYNGHTHYDAFTLKEGYNGKEVLTQLMERNIQSAQMAQLDTHSHYLRADDKSEELDKTVESPNPHEEDVSSSFHSVSLDQTAQSSQEARPRNSSSKDLIYNLLELYNYSLKIINKKLKAIRDFGDISNIKEMEEKSKKLQAYYKEISSSGKFNDEVLSKYFNAINSYFNNKEGDSIKEIKEFLTAIELVNQQSTTMLKEESYKSFFEFSANLVLACAYVRANNKAEVERLKIVIEKKRKGFDTLKEEFKIATFANRGVQTFLNKFNTFCEKTTDRSTSQRKKETTENNTRKEITENNTPEEEENPPPSIVMKKIPVNVQAKLNTIGLEYIPLPESQNSLYHAVALSIGRQEHDLREEVEKLFHGKLEKSFDFLRNMIICAPFIIKEGMVEQLVQAVEEKIEWADDIEVDILMLMLNRPIIKIGINGNVINLNRAVKNGEPIFIYYNGRNYDGLRLKVDLAVADIIVALEESNALWAPSAVNAKNIEPPALKRLKLSPNFGPFDSISLRGRINNSVPQGQDPIALMRCFLTKKITREPILFEGQFYEHEAAPDKKKKEIIEGIKNRNFAVLCTEPKYLVELYFNKEIQTAAIKAIYDGDSDSLTKYIEDEPRLLYENLDKEAIYAVELGEQREKLLEAIIEKAEVQLFDLIWLLPIKEIQEDKVKSRGRNKGNEVVPKTRVEIFEQLLDYFKDITKLDATIKQYIEAAGIWLSTSEQKESAAKTLTWWFEEKLNNFMTKDYSRALVKAASGLTSDPNICDSVIGAAKELWEDYDYYDLLLYLLEVGNNKLFRFFLMRLNDINFRGTLYNETLLHIAVRKNKQVFVGQLLVGKQANPLVRNNEGFSPIDLAVINFNPQNRKILELMLNNCRKRGLGFDNSQLRALASKYNEEFEEIYKIFDNFKQKPYEPTLYWVSKIKTFDNFRYKDGHVLGDASTDHILYGVGNRKKLPGPDKPNQKIPNDILTKISFLTKVYSEEGKPEYKIITIEDEVEDSDSPDHISDYFRKPDKSYDKEGFIKDLQRYHPYYSSEEFENGWFENHFHHSERALFKRLEKSTSALVHKLKEKLIDYQMPKVKGLILDMNSTRNICTRCREGLHYFQSKDSLFVQQLEKALFKEGVNFSSNGLYITTRYSWVMRNKNYKGSAEFPEKKWESEDVNIKELRKMGINAIFQLEEEPPEPPKAPLPKPSTSTRPRR